MKKIVTYLLYFCSFSILTAQENKILLDGVQAIVGENMILKSEVDFEVERYKEQGYENINDVYCFIWREKLFEKLLIHKAGLDSVEVSANEIDGEIERRLQYMLAQMKGSEEEFEKYFNKSVLEFKAEMKPIIEKSIMARKMQGKITGNVEVSPKEVQNFYKSISKDSLPVIKEKFKIAQIEIKPKSNQFEEERIKKDMEDIRRQILEEKRDFGLLALVHSEDPGSKTKKGELGFISKEQLVPEFATVAFNLKPNEVSPVIKSRYGYHIIQMIGKKGTLINVRHILKIPQVYSFDVELAKKKADSVYKAITNNPEDFGKIATQVSDDDRTNSNGGVLSNPQTGEDYFEPSILPKDIYFGIQGLKIGAFSKPSLATTVEGSNIYRIVKLVDKTNFHTATIENDYEKIKNAALANKKEKVLENWILKYIKGTYIQMPSNMEYCNLLSVYYTYLEQKDKK